MKRLLLILTVLGLSLCGQLVKNGDFSLGEGEEVSNWKLGVGPGGVVEGENRGIYVIGEGEDCTYWLSDPVPFSSNGTYRIRFRARGVKAGNGTAVTGPVFANIDIGCPKGDWREYTNVFVAPKNVGGENSRIRLGQWHSRGRIEFDDVSVVPVHAIYHSEGGMVLGEGEKVSVSGYECQLQFGGSGRNHSRVLAEHNCGFNTNRWFFGENSYVTYCHQIGGRTQGSGKLELTVNYHVGGALKVEASRDGSNWVEIASQSEQGQVEVDLPASLYPAEKIWIRLSAVSGKKVGAKDSDPGSFQVNAYKYAASVSGTPTEVVGSTQYFEERVSSAGLEASILGIGDGLPGGANVVRIKAKNTSGKAMSLVPSVMLNKQFASNADKFDGAKVDLPAGGEAELTVQYEVPGTGKWELQAFVRAGGEIVSAFATEMFISDFFDTSYGELLDDSKDCAVWWASSGWKIPLVREAPKTAGAWMAVSGARGESEAAQLVLKARRQLENVTVTATDLSGRGGVIPASCIDLLRVHYSEVTVKTDATSILGMWPDALPPLKAGLKVKEGNNQPIWVRVNIPEDARAGSYSGKLKITASGGFEKEVTLKVKVFNFDLPKKMTCETAFGFSVGTCFTYQKPKTEAERRQIWESYMEMYSRHHISPYNPAQLDPFKFTLEGMENRWTGHGKVVKESKDEGGYSLFLNDDTTTGRRAVSFPVKMPAKGKFRLKITYKTNPGHTFVASFNHFNDAGNWISGNNRDFAIKGDGTWQTFEATFDTYPKNAVSHALAIHATIWEEKGELTGQVWIDDISIVDVDTGKVYIDDPISPVDVSKLRIKFDWTAWDAAMTKAFDEYHFNCVRFPITGLGGGTFHSRTEPSFMGFAEDTPEYEKLFADYLGQIEAHLKEKGWLDKAYVYWFDEPDAKDYEFVMNGFRKLKKYAPGLRRMLTEQIEPELIGGPNLWCPVTPNLRKEQVKERNAEGEQFWWYVCTGPKAPYATLFIDHPGTEMRVWLWQTWDFGVDGILVWASNYWTSGCAYPDKPQNPYEDPMGWVSGYDTPKGVKRPWGNGDGRFVYPPEAAADGQQEETVLDDPVSSIRFEMLRDGIEDYEYFVMLKSLLAKKKWMFPWTRAKYEKLLEVPADVSKSMTEFTINPATYEKHREKLAAAIEALQ